jgi:type VI secretion system secreted protein VgrG
MAEITQDARLLKVYTPLDFDVLLIERFSGHEGLSQPFHFDIELLADVQASQQQHVVPDKLIGGAIAIEVQLRDGNQRFLNGMIRSFTKQGQDERFARYRAEMVPWISFLSYTANCRIYQQKTVPDIISALIAERGFSKYFRSDLSRTYTVWDYCVQYRETDLAFLGRLMEAEGIYYYFEHNENRTHTLVLADGPDAHKDCPGESNFRFDPEAGVGEFEDTIDHWETRQELLTGKWVLRDYHFEMPSNNLEVPENSVFANEVSSKLERFDFPGEYAKKFNEPESRLAAVRPEGEKLVRARMEEEETSHIVIQGSGRCRAFACGYKATVSGNGEATVDGTWLLTSIQHSALQHPNYESEERQEGGYTNTFTAISASTQYYPARTTPKPVMYGPQTAIVIDENPEPQEEIWPDKYGRVRVRFHWDREAKNACWIRVAQTWAGKSWGQQWIPRVGDEVIVAFLDGDPDCPIVIGSVYNHDNMPPFTLPDNKTQSGILTRSSPNGGSADYNMIRIEDKAGSEEIFVHAQKALTTEVEQNESRRVDGGRTTTVNQDDKCTVQKGNDELTVQTGDRKVTISKGNDALTVQLGNITVQANAGTHKTQAMQVETDGTTTVKLSCGASSIEMTPATITITSPMVKINC